MIAVLALAIVLPIVLRRLIDARHTRKLINRNSQTLHRHYERVDDAKQLQRLPAELRLPGSTIRVEFAVVFDGSDASDRARDAWNAVERLGLAVRSERTGPDRVTVFGSTTLPGSDVTELTHFHLQLEHVASDYEGAYAGWNAELVKRAG